MTPEDTPLVVLALNPGSSSLKFALYAMGPGTPSKLAQGAVEHIGQAQGQLWLKRHGTERLSFSGAFADAAAAVKAVFGLLERHALPEPGAVGHRFVSGGPRYLDHRVIDAAFLADIARLTEFAPLHLPAAILGVHAVTADWAHIPQVACFDTAFYRDLPAVSARLALPRRFWDEGVRRYGFHGLSYEFLVGELGEEASGRVIMAHLGNGASMTAVKDRRPQDTTMGMTPGGGLIMGTRCGDLDPGIVVYLLRERGYGVDELEGLLERESGLLGISGSTWDMQALLLRQDHDERARDAVEAFSFVAGKYAAAMASVLGGVDSLVFTGGIGERAAAVRAEICRRLAFAGVDLDESANARHDRRISSDASRVRVLVVPTDEELVIARHTNRLVRALSGPESGAARR